MRGKLLLSAIFFLLDLISTMVKIRYKTTIVYYRRIPKFFLIFCYLLTFALFSAVTACFGYLLLFSASWLVFTNAVSTNPLFSIIFLWFSLFPLSPYRRWCMSWCGKAPTPTSPLLATARRWTWLSRAAASRLCWRSCRSRRSSEFSPRSTPSALRARRMKRRAEGIAKLRWYACP